MATELSDTEIALIYKTLDARLQTRMCKESDSAINHMKAFQSEIESSKLFTQSSEEAQYVVQNMIVQEIYSYMYEKDMKSPELKPYILSQYEKIEKYRESSGKDKLSSWFIVSSAEVINSSMQFIPQSTAIKMGLQEKADFDYIAENYPEHSTAFLNRALWYYFAPGIGGGSKTTARNDFKQAVENSVCDYEKYYSRIFYSQICFEEGDVEKCTTLLKECDSLMPNTNYTDFIRKLNANNYNLLYYTNNREKVEKKLGWD